VLQCRLLLRAPHRPSRNSMSRGTT
jgi:hypothetical protein